MKIVILGLLPYNYLKENGIEYFLPESHPATWMTNLLYGVTRKLNIDLYYISTSKEINRTKRFIINGINFIILPRGMPFIRKGYPMWFKLDAFTNYYILRKKIQYIINGILPNVINAHGTEYVYSLVLNDLKFPSVVTIQGIVNFWKEHTKNSFVTKQAHLENQVFENQNNYLVPDIPTVRSYILSQNKNAIFFHAWYPVDKLAYTIIDQKNDSDIVFASRISIEKGILDVLQAVQVIKKHDPTIKLKIIGIQTPGTDILIKAKIIEYGISDNVNFIGYIQSKEDFYNEIKKSKILVVPSHFDVAPLVIRESMALGVPVVAYETDGIPFLLENGKCGLLVEKYNINKLASEISQLLKDKKLYEQLKSNALEKAINEFTPESCFLNFYNCYLQITNKQISR